jgi:hypothetical protein
MRIGQLFLAVASIKAAKLPTKERIIQTGLKLAIEAGLVMRSPLD